MKKKRTRDHVIADLAVNWVERQILLCGYSLQEISRDYGIDLLMFTYNDQGEAEPGFVLFQVKATEKVKLHPTTSTIPFRVNRTDLMTWLGESLPIILALYDVEADGAYWLYVQAHCAAIPNFNPFTLGRTVTLHIPSSHVLDQESVRRFAGFRDHVYAQIPNKLLLEE